jgi:hypothetical protein
MHKLNEKSILSSLHIVLVPKLPSSGGVHQKSQVLFTSKYCIQYTHPSIVYSTYLDVNNTCDFQRMPPADSNLVTETYVGVIKYTYQ